MPVWVEPDVTQHVNDNTDYRLANLFEKLVISSASDTTGSYSYDVTGEDVTKIEVYDISCTALMEHFYEYRDQCTATSMSSSDNYATSKIANNVYENVTFGSLILLMNNKYTNADFVLDTSEEYNVLPYEKVKKLIFGQDANASKIVREVTDTDEYMEIMNQVVNADKNIYKPTTDQLVNSKMKANYTDVEDKPEYKRLLAEFGEDELNKLIMKATTYNKDASDDE